MSKYELSLCKDYVPHWGIVEAVRELFQNIRDQEAVDATNSMFFEYSNGTLRLGNKKSVLEASSLLLGTSTKRDDDKLIGQHGEGYKVATLVLIRLGKTITFYNYGAREIWEPRFVKSRRYKADVLTFFVDKKYPWSSVPDNNLTIEVNGITDDEWQQIVESNLFCQPKVETINTSCGSILLDPRHKGKVFVGGLFVCDYKPYVYGYNFNPGKLKLDRDRKLVSDFDLAWLSSTMWRECIPKRVLELIKIDAADIMYIKNQYQYSFSSGAYKDVVCDQAHDDFKAEYGEDAVPVTNNDELQQVMEEYKDAKPVMVPDNYAYAVKASSKYKEPEIVVKISLHDELITWVTSIQHLIPTNKLNDFYKLISNVKE